MLRRTPSRAAALVTGLVAVSAPVSAPIPAHAAAPQGYGPQWPYTEVLYGEPNFISLPDASMITKTNHGYLYRSGQQDSDLVVTQVEGGLRFHDRGTKEWKELAGGCERRTVSEGIAAVCQVPEGISADNHLLLEIWPRLGDDHVDTSALPASDDVAVLADAGVDVVTTGPGNDFINGAQDGDTVSGGRGNDWIRTGIGDDRIRGGRGRDYLVGSDQDDTIRGGAGDDQVYGGTGSDDLLGNRGVDLLSCSTGIDSALVDAEDRAVACETVAFR
jgi:serralysin